MGQENQPEAGKVQGENNKEGMRTSTKWAIGVTAVWLGGVAAYVVCNWCTFLKMEPNAIGDFLAGTMSPLALFWLVAGYMQQGEELRLNTEALTAQLTELALQVKATKELGDSAKKQAEIAELNHHFEKKRFAHEEDAKREAHKKKIMPVFDVKFSSMNPMKSVFRLFNTGGDAFDLECWSDHPDFALKGDHARFKKDAERELVLANPLSFKSNSLEFKLVCHDEDRFRHDFSFTIQSIQSSKPVVIQNHDV